VWSTNRAFSVLGDTLDALCCGLLCWQNTSQFLHLVKIIDTSKPLTDQCKQKTELEKEISTFNSNLVQFYKFGSQSFLTVKIVGDAKTFCMHCLWFYMPHIVDITWERYKVGVGIFTM